MVAGGVVAAELRAQARPEGRRGRRSVGGHRGRGAADLGPLPRRAAGGRGHGSFGSLARGGERDVCIRRRTTRGSQPRRFQRGHPADRNGGQPPVVDAGGGQPARRSAGVPTRRQAQEDQLARDVPHGSTARRHDAHRARHRRAARHGHAARRAGSRGNRCDVARPVRTGGGRAVTPLPGIRRPGRGPRHRPQDATCTTGQRTSPARGHHRRVVPHQPWREPGLPGPADPRRHGRHARLLLLPADRRGVHHRGRQAAAAGVRGRDDRHAAGRPGHVPRAAAARSQGPHLAR